MSSKKKATKRTATPKLEFPVVLKEGDYPIISGGTKYPPVVKATSNLYQRSVSLLIPATTTSTILTFTGRYLTCNQLRIFGNAAASTFLLDSTGALLTLVLGTTTTELFFPKPYYFKDYIQITNNNLVAITYYLDVQGELNQEGFIP